MLLQGTKNICEIAQFHEFFDFRLGGNPDNVNPQCPADLVIDHSVQVDFSRSAEARAKNEALEFSRNKERFTFLKWGASAFDNMLIVPPGSGIVHQVNLEYLARVCFTNGQVVYPDSVVGTGNPINPIAMAVIQFTLSRFAHDHDQWTRSSWMGSGWN